MTSSIIEKQTRNIVDSTRTLPPRSEFFDLFWYPIFEQAQKQGLSRADAEHVTRWTLEEIFEDGCPSGKGSG